MTENDRPHSGSRWEPTAAPSPEPSPVPSPSLPASGVRRLPAGLRRRAALAGAAAGLLAVGGLGGFALGHEAGQQTTRPAGVVQNGPGLPGDERNDGSDDRSGSHDDGADDDGADDDGADA